MTENNDAYRRPRLSEIKEVMERVKQHKRAVRVSPILEWWLEKKKENKPK